MTNSTENTNSKTTTDTTTDENGYEVPVTDDTNPDNKDDTSADGDDKDSTGYGKDDDSSDGDDKDGDDKDKDIKDSTGYGKDSKDGESDDTSDTDTNSDADKDDDKNNDDKETSEEELKSVIKELPESVDQEKILKFAKDHKLTKEQVKAYGEMMVADSEAAVENQKAQVLAVRKQWKQELMDDADFGGENFDKNVFEVNKTLDKHLPNMKKRLTETGNVLPPYIMRDLLGLSKLLNPKTPLVNGEAGKVEEKKSFLDDMYQ